MTDHWRPNTEKHNVFKVFNLESLKYERAFASQEEADDYISKSREKEHLVVHFSVFEW